MKRRVGISTHFLQTKYGDAEALKIAKSIGAGLAKNVCAATVDNKECDLRTPLNSDCELSLLTFDDEYGKWGNVWWNATKCTSSTRCRCKSTI